MLQLLRARLLMRDHEASPEALRQALTAAIDAAAADETVILFFAGHGVRDEAGRLFLATSGLRTEAIAATALPWGMLWARRAPPCAEPFLPAAPEPREPCTVLGSIFFMMLGRSKAAKAHVEPAYSES